MLLAAIPTPDHVVVVVEENHSYSDIIGNSSAPYLNSLAQQGALFTNFTAVTHPSEPNYLALFSGSTQGITDDSVPPPLSGPSLGSELLDAGKTFVGYAESLPASGFTGATSGEYARKHAPWIDFTNIPAASSQPFTSFPSDFNQLPTLSFVVPNLQDDMHDGTPAQGDAWLAANIDPYAQWAKTHNSLLIVTWDEDDLSENNHIPTIVIGPMVAPGEYAEPVGHYNMLRTLEGMYGLPSIGQSSSVTPITDIWSAVIAPTITISKQPADQAVDEGQPVTFAIEADSALPLSYQWFRNGQPISGATSAGYTLLATSAADNDASFSVSVNNSALSMTSDAAVLTVKSAPPSPLPPPVIVTRGNPFLSRSVRLIGSATSVNGAPLTKPDYRWSVSFHHDGAIFPITVSGPSIKQIIFRSLRSQSIGVGDFYSVTLSVTDTQGQVSTSQIELAAPVETLTVSASIAGLQFQFDGNVMVAPAVITVVANTRHTLAAIQDQTVNGNHYHFLRWTRSGKQIVNVSVKNKNMSVGLIYGAGLST